MKAIVLYYSYGGNNAFLAKKIAQTLTCDIEEIVPRVNVMPVLMMFSLVKWSFGSKPLSHSIEEYDRVILVGPIWAGQLISPLQDMIKKYRAKIKKLYFVTCCGGDESTKDSKFGYVNVFKQAEKLYGETCAYCDAFSIRKALPEDKQHDDNAVMKVKLQESNFKGALEERFNNLIRAIR